MSSHRCFFALVSLALPVAGCRERQVASYRVLREKELPPASVAAGAPSSPAPNTPAMSGNAVSTANGPGLTWTAPTHWKPIAASAMRKGSYAVAGIGGADADLSITAFPGDVGGELANLNRWRGQLSLAPASAAELAATITRFEQGGLKFAVVDFDNGQQRLLGAIVPVSGSTWFFKLLGPAATLAKEKSAFLEFLQTVKAPSSATP
ncbi:MAG: hypothetical protein EXS32_06105 [Opitutus sp.]|nr:hypothetical protein [Opitutus sp.]